MKRPIALLFCLLMITMPLAGCFGGDDSSDAQDEELDDWNVHFAATAADLPNCDEDTNGRLYYVEADNQFQVCKTSGWSVIDIQGVDGDQGAQGLAGDDGADGEDGTSILITSLSSTSCANGGNTFNIGPDSNSNGFLEAAEVLINVDICNGAEGPQGPQGPQGLQGLQGPAGNNGTNGTDGVNGSAFVNSGTWNTTLLGNTPSNGEFILDGTLSVTTLTIAAIDSDAVSMHGLIESLSPGDTITISQSYSNYGIFRIESTFIQMTADRYFGPLTHIEGPITTLDDDSGTSYQITRNGPQGPAGNDGSTALIATSTEPAGTNCANGGVKIEAGVDDNGNGQLDSNEVDSTQYICDGGSSATTMLTSYSTPPTSMGCDVGGSVIAHGLDNGDGGGTAANGQLESGEVDYSTTFCTKSTLLRIDIVDDAGCGCPGGLTVFNNQLYFEAYYPSSGWELWKYDGVSAPSMVADINPGPFEYSSPSGLTVFNNTLYFIAYEGTSGRELWKYNGHNAPSMVADIRSGSSSSYPNDLIVFNNALYFEASDGVNGYELWKYDGNNAPSMVADINSGGGSSSPNDFVVFNNELYFEAYEGTNGRELWKYDGVNAPSMVADINSGGGSSSPNDLVVLNNALYFEADDGTNGDELWKYDGVSAPSMVADINSGSGSSDLEYLTVFNNELYFSANDGTHGDELWRYDGTNAPSMVADINAEQWVFGGDGSPSDLTVFNNELYFEAYSPWTGKELWRYSQQTTIIYA